MSVVVVGGDYLGAMEKKLFEWGVTRLRHVTGRKALERNKISIPKDTDFVLVLTDYVSHTVAKNAKQVAKAQSIPLIFAKHSWRSVEEKLKEGFS